MFYKLIDERVYVPKCIAYFRAIAVVPDVRFKDSFKGYLDLVKNNANIIELKNGMWYYNGKPLPPFNIEEFFESHNKRTVYGLCKNRLPN